RHNVFIYENTSTLNEFSNPDGILRCVLYPHGMRFTSDNRFVLVADAGAPYVHVYFRNQLSWRGVHAPLLSVRVLTDEDYLRGRMGPEHGGPKGLDIGNYMNMLVLTCANHPLCFFDLAKVIDNIDNIEKDSDEQRSIEMSYEMYLQEESVR